MDAFEELEETLKFTENKKTTNANGHKYHQHHLMNINILLNATKVFYNYKKIRGGGTTFSVLRHAFIYCWVSLKPCILLIVSN